MDPSSRLVFVVDDNVDLLNLTCHLVGLLGLMASPFNNAEACLAAILVNAPACVVSDFNMPGMNGLEFMEALKAQGIEVPVLMVTAIPSNSDEMVEIRRLAYSVLSKPCRLDDLAEALRKALKGAHGSEGLALPR